MGRLNNFFKWLVMNVNLVYAAVALVTIILAVIVLFSDWGDLDKGFIVVSLSIKIVLKFIVLYDAGVVHYYYFIFNPDIDDFAFGLHGSKSSI